ncbi:hypothetical protein B0G83_11851 [Paraburkholderia sp. BL21I4N1]|nr:hypothetical protein B0G83_11851 [Paraburkholderia sp. BL21I4N1]
MFSERHANLPEPEEVKGRATCRKTGVVCADTASDNAHSPDYAAAISGPPARSCLSEAKKSARETSKILLERPGLSSRVVLARQQRLAKKKPPLTFLH